MLIGDDVGDDIYKACAKAISERDSDALLAAGHDSAYFKSFCYGGWTEYSAEQLISVSQDTGEVAKLTKTVLTVVDMLHQIWPDLPITLDLLDRREGDYHKGLNFALYGKGLRGEIARGGAYVTGFGEEQQQVVHLYGTCFARFLLPNAPRIYVAAKAGLMTAMALVSRGRDVVMGS